ncbi:MAG: hypothetical protein ACOYLB_04350 [Phototrophicaceae bacterium]
MQKFIEQIRKAGILGLSSDQWYSMQVREVRWIRHAGGIRRYFWMTVWATALVSLAMVAMGMMLWLQNIVNPNSVAIMAGVLLFSAFAFGLFFIFLSISVDFYSVFNAVGLVRRERESGRLDLMRLSMSERGLLDALQSLSVSRTWRVVTWIVSVRIIWGGIGTLVGLIAWLIIWIAQPDYRIYTWFGVLWIPIGFIFTYWQAVIEPIWRVRLLSALGLYISERTNNRTTAIVYGLVGLFILNTVTSFGTQILQIPFNMLSFATGFMEEGVFSIPPIFIIALGFIVPFSALILMIVSILIAHALREWLLQSTVNHMQ